MTTRDAGGMQGLRTTCRPGSGPVVAWVHGYTLDSTVWSRLWRLLPQFAHVGIDLPGHGESRALAGDERLDVLGQQVAEICGAHEAHHLVGLSFGGTVALQAAMERPGQIWSLVLGSPGLSGAPTDPASAVRYRQLTELYALHGPGRHMTGLWMASPPAIFDGARSHPDLWRELESVIDRHRWHELANGAMRSLSAAVQDPADLSRIGADTTVLIGSDDMAAFRYSAALIADGVAAGRAVVMSAAGHLSLLERPAASAELIARLVDEAEQRQVRPRSS